MRPLAARALTAMIAALALAITLTAAPVATRAGGTSHAVQIVDFAFAPATLTVSVGDTVTWTNLDAVVHTATSTTGAWDSGDLDQNESYSLTFTAAVTYDYLCTPHPGMTGRIVVQAVQPAPTASPAPSRAGPTLPNVAMPPPRTPWLAIIGVGLIGAGALAAALRLRRR